LLVPDAFGRNDEATMFEEIRNHDPKPNAQERAWMQADPFRVVARVMALTVLALVITTAATTFNAQPTPVVASASR
jgi:hypothetical protein